MVISIRWALGLLALYLAASAVTVPASAEGPGLTKASRVSFRGIGPVRIGMTLKEAEQAVGAVLAHSEIEEGTGCEDVGRADGNDVATFMAIDGIIRRVDIVDPGILTVSGVGVGDTEEAVKRVYGAALHVEQHFYNPKGHYLIVDSPDGQNEILFETDGNKVTVYRTGRRQEVGYVEGCL